MATTVATLEAQLTADTSRFKKGLGSAERDMKGFGGRTGAIMKGVGVAAVAGAAVAGAAIVGVAVKGVTEFAKFDKSMNEVFTLLPGMSEDAMSQMEDDVLALSNKMGVLPEETVPALYQALSAGVPKDNVFEFMENANKLAIGGVAELDASVGALTGVVNAYTDGSVSSAEAADMMFTTVKNGVTTIPELAASLGEVTPIAAALGIGFDEVSAAMATSTKVTQNTSKSATGLKSMLAELGKGGSIASKAFEDLSGKSFPQFIKEGGNLSGAMKILDKGAKDNGKSMIDMFGSIEAGQEALRLAADGSAELDEQLRNMEGSTGAAEGAFDQMDQGLARSWDKIKTTATTALIKIGKKLAPFVEQAAEWLGEKLPAAIDWLIAAFEKIAPVVSDIVKTLVAYWEWVGPKIMAAFEVIAPIVVGVFETIRGVVETVVSWFKGDATADVEAGASKIAKIFQSIYDYAKPIWDKVYGVVKVAVELVKKIIDLTMKAVIAIWETHGERIWNYIKTTFDNISDFIQGVMDAIKGIIDVVMGILTGDWERAWEGIKLFVSGIWDAIWAVVDQMIAAVETTIVLAMDAIQVAWEFVWNAISTFIGTIWEGIKTAVGTAVEWVRSTLATKWDEAKTKVETIWNGISGFISGIWDDIKYAVLIAVQWVKVTLAGVWDTISTKVHDIWEGILTWITDRWEDIKTTASTAIGWVRDTLAGIWDTIARKVSDIWGTIVSTVENAVDDIIAAVLRIPIIPDIGNLPIPGPKGILGGDTRTAPTPKTFNPYTGTYSAAGGIATSATLSWVGEGGEPEAIVPLSKAGQFGFGGGGGDTYITVEGNMLGTLEDFVELVESERRQYRLRGGAMA